MRLKLFGCCSLLVAAACSRSGPAIVDAGEPDVAGPADVVALPREVVITLQSALSDGGTQIVVFRPDEKPTLEPAGLLHLSTNLVLRNYRIRVFDEADKALVSDDTPHELPDRVVYDVALAEPLKTGHRYAIVLDPQLGAVMTDSRGESHAEKRLEFTVSGEREKPVPKPVRAKKRRR